jgi:glycosyltransferase involved in cell wall biosynthesis
VSLGVVLLEKPSFAESSNYASKPIEPISSEEIGAGASRAITANRFAQLRDLPRKFSARTLWARTPGNKNGAPKLDAPNNEHECKVDLKPAYEDGTVRRPHVRGKFLFVGEEKFWVRGVTYGTFRPDEDGTNYPSPDAVERDFRAIRDAGLNSVRVYTVPPRWLLDLAAARGLRLMIGLPWEQHVAFLDDKAREGDIIDRVGAYVRQCAGHPAVLCYVVGNEIPASIVRWYGKRRIQNFLAKLCEIVRRQDPGALLSYVNYPTTEYLETPFVDFVAFNVYLESRERLAAYLARLQNLAGELPLILAEVGLDSRRNGEKAQAAALKWQIETIFEGGCAGAFVFAWTDEWHRGGYDIEDWDFGLTTRDRRAKPALGSVAKAFREIPFARDHCWPRVSVAVCSYNGSKTIDETLTALSRLNYPDYEVIVVDDGSTDTTAAIAHRHRVCLVQSENKGLSSARNLAMETATGEIIAYIDDDAYPDPDWLKFLAASFARSDYVGIGGPNIAPPRDGLIADSVAHAPGGPVHVLLTDEVAEHIPGCNMAYRLDELRSIGGFDPRFRIAGDDVDICWRFQERGWTLGFSSAAVVWHHRRRSIRAYWKQQKGYAHAEALLADKWPQQYNGAGHLNWSGKLYGKGIVDFFLYRPRIYHGTWGSSLFQSIYEPSRGLLISLPLMPEWYFLVAVSGALAAFGLLWSPLLWVAPIFILAVAASLIQAGVAASQQQLDAKSLQHRLALKALIAWLHLIQPLARLLGRVRHGVAPWRLTGLLRPPLRLRHTHAIWSEEWRPIERRLEAIERILLREREAVRRGGDFDRWDLEVRGGLLGYVRSVGMIEEHGAGKQLFRLRAWPHIPRPLIVSLFPLGSLAALAAYDQALLPALVLGAGAIAITMIARAECAKAMQVWNEAVAEYAQADVQLADVRLGSGATSPHTTQMAS